jgi:tRNA1Val (adenine37-N6)-methyltransferase
MALKHINLPQDYFEFKQFKVCQAGAAMKVSTDACIQAALAAIHLEKIAPKSLLDIGTGTGLLSLMLAQKLQTTLITAIDIEVEAVEQAKHNFRNSPWKDRLQAAQIALQDLSNDETYEAIICNPPFFHKHLGSSEGPRHTARHDDSLSKEDLFQNAKRLLSHNGSLCVLYPQNEWAQALQVATAVGFKLYSKVEIRPNVQKAVNRMVGFFAQQPQPTIKDTLLTIYEYPTKEYTPSFTKLLKDYYLYL